MEVLIALVALGFFVVGVLFGIYIKMPSSRQISQLAPKDECRPIRIPRYRQPPKVPGCRHADLDFADKFPKSTFHSEGEDPGLQRGLRDE